MQRTAWVWMVIPVVAACADRAQQPAEPSVAIAEQVTMTWLAAYESADPDALLSLYADDATLRTPRAPALRGSAAIREYWSQRMVDRDMISLEVSESHGEGNVLFVQGEYQSLDDGGAARNRGDFTQLWVRVQAAWQLVSDNWRDFEPDAGQRGATDQAGELLAQWTARHDAGDSGALALLYRPDATMFVAGQGAIEGRPDIERYWAHNPEYGGVTATLDATDVRVDTATAWLGGRFAFTDASGEMAMAGRFSQLWIRSGDDWHIQHETWIAGSTR